MKKQLKEKILESISSVLPITAIVLILSVSVAPVTSGTLVLFLFGALLLIFGMGLFTLGADLAMTPMGEGMGIEMSKSKNPILPVIIGFVFGVIITMAEPDLKVLAEQVPAIPNMVLMAAVAAGVGIFMTIAIIRIFFQISLNTLLIFFYALIFIVAFFSPETFIPVSFDSGGVTTGPITATFLLPFAMGACTALDGNILTDAFGIVAMVAMTPLITIQSLGFSSEMKRRARTKSLKTQFEQIEDIVLYFDTE